MGTAVKKLQSSLTLQWIAKRSPLPPILIALLSCFAVPAHLKVEPPASLEATVGEDSLLRCQVAGDRKDHNLKIEKVVESPFLPHKVI